MIKKYTIEGDVDFFSELNNLKTEEEPTNDDNICLITYEPLSDRYIKMNCGHTFNYVPLFNDLLNHKNYQEKQDQEKQNQKKQNQQKPKNKIKIGQPKIRCPYCRKTTTKLLPCYEGFHASEITVDNSIPLCKEIIKTGPKKGLCCGIKSVENNLCKRHYKKINNINI